MIIRFSQRQRFAFVPLLIALLVSFTCISGQTSRTLSTVPTVQTPNTPPPLIVIKMPEWEKAKPETLREYLKKQGIGPNDKVLLYLHGALSGKLENDIPFAQALASKGGYTKAVAIKFPETIEWQSAVGSETKKQAAVLAKVVAAINSITSPPDAFCFSAGAVVCAKSLSHGARYGTVELAGYPFPAKITPEMKAKADKILNFWSWADLLTWGEIKGATNIYCPWVQHGQWNDIDEKRLSLFADGLQRGKSAGIKPSSSPVDVKEPPLPDNNRPLDDPDHDNYPFFAPFDGGGGAAAIVSPTLTEKRNRQRLDTGGVDFSSLQLNYFTDFSDEEISGLSYVFRANKIKPGEVPVKADESARLTSDSFFIWLSLPNNKFWVNLNPSEPNRVIDAELGKTEVGRIMLEADYGMKKTIANLIHPDNPLGQSFWDNLYAYAEKRKADRVCFSFRQWIVPGNVTVWASDNSIYIVDAALDVKLESEYLKLTGDNSTLAAACPPDADPDVQKYAEKLFRNTILPEVITQINTSPEYRDLRNIFQSRIVAEWYKIKKANGRASFSKLIEHQDITKWHSTVTWNPQNLFERYVQSLKQGEFHFTRQTKTASHIYARTYFYGGVDFSRVPMSSITTDALLIQRPSVQQQVFDSILIPTGYSDETETWLGGLYIRNLPDAATTPPISSTLRVLLICIAAILLVLLTLVVGQHLRLKATGNS